MLKQYYLHAMKKEVTVYNMGISGDTSDDLLKRFSVECAAREPTVVIFAIGINDSRYIDDEDHSDVSLEQYEQNLQKLIDGARVYTSEIYSAFSYYI